LGAANWLCGLSVVVTVAFEIPIFHYGMRLLEYIGVPNMLLIAQAAFAFRAIGYTMLQNPLFVLFLEVLRKMNNPTSPNTIAFIKKEMLTRN
jgi:hypothetical protein